MAYTQAARPQLPQAAKISGEAQAQFLKLKRELSEIASWELAPNTWDRIKLEFSEGGTEAQANAFMAVIGK